MVGGLLMKKRIITGIVLAIILIPLLLIKDLFPLVQVVIMFFFIIATVEMIHMCERTKKFSIGVKILIVFMTFLIYMGIVNEDPSATDSIITKMMNKLDFKVSILTTLTIACVLVFACQVFVKDFDAADVGRCFMIILYVSLGFSSFTILLFYGMRFIIYIVLVCVFTDIFALVFGIRFGKHKLCPTISPKKTWEGAIGGTACATIAGSLFAILYHYFGHYFVPAAEPIRFFEGIFNIEGIPNAIMVITIIILTIFVSIGSQVGDLVCSKFKRTYDIKDFSNIFPGHGGVLDRFDSILFSSIIFLCFITVVRIAWPIMMGL